MELVNVAGRGEYVFTLLLLAVSGENDGGGNESPDLVAWPFILVTDQGNKIGVREGGSLRDISPTILSLLQLELPKQMTGGDLRTAE